MNTIDIILLSIFILVVLGIIVFKQKQKKNPKLQSSCCACSKEQVEKCNDLNTKCEVKKDYN